jgi:hypothetical protein
VLVSTLPSLIASLRRKQPMNIVDRLFGHKSLTVDWNADPGVALRVDLSTCRFCGAAPGDPIERLTHLGPADRAWVQGDEDVLVYQKLGLQIFLDENGQLGTVDINLLDEKDMAAFSGSWHFRGQPITVAAESTPEQIEATLGEPDKKFGGRAVLYVRVSYGIWFEWGDDGSLENVVLSTRDMLPS